MIGTQIGPYRIDGKLGAGGMGEVYRARDTKLNRDVALKVLPELVANDPDRRARFEREAQALAALNHPHIAHIYGAEEAEGGKGQPILALVMELVDGPTLAEVIASRGSGLPVDEAVAIARQIADALEAAHAAGIVHRDLKPANIKVRPDGVVKVLDFGLARMVDTNPLAPAAMDSPTVLSPAVTAHGVILGTAAYMAPEQARGKIADARSDLWAFGVVLFEMLTGRPLFSGKTTSDVLASVLRDDPKWETLPADTPPHVRTLLHRCLQRDPAHRLRNAGDARLELDDASDDAAGAARATHPASRILLPALTILCLTGLAIVFGSFYRAKPPDVRVRKFLIPQRYQGGGLHVGGRIPIISPDGTRVAYIDGGQLWVRDLDALASREVPIPTESATAGWPVFSPDGKSLAFAAARAWDKVSLFRMPAAGGEVSRICDLPPGMLWGLAWRPDGTIIANVAGTKTFALYRVEESGGNMRLMPIPGGGAALQLRGFRDGTLVYTHGDAKGDSLDFVGMDGGVASIPSDVLHAGFGSFWSEYSPSGHLLFVRGSEQYVAALWAVPFDFPARRVSGDPFRVAEFAEGASVSADGTLVYQHLGHARMQLEWVDRRGQFVAAVGQPQQMMLDPSISWDGSRAAVFGIDDYKRGIWIHDLARQSKSRLNLPDLGAPHNPVWQPGDARLTYLDGWTLQDVGVEGGTPSNPLAGMDTGATLDATWSRDGRYLAFAGYAPDTRGDIWVLERGEKKPHRVADTAAGECCPALAPDGHHLAYLSDETGRPELFVRTFPSGSDTLQVTSNGAAFPTWSRRGDEIFFVQGHTLMTVPVKVGPTLQFGTPQRLFDLEEHAGRVRLYDTIDGQRFLVVRTIEPWEDGIAVVQNWYEEFRRK